MTTNTMETMVRTENKQEAEEVMEFLGTLNQQEKEKFLSFIDGIKFAKSQIAGAMKTA